MSSINTNTASLPGYQLLSSNNVASVPPEAVKASDTKTVEDVKRSAQPQISRAELQQAVDIVNQAVALDKRALSFSIDDVSGRSVIKVVDFNTDELIRQIPSEELLKVAQDIRQLQDQMGRTVGFLLDKRV